MARAAVEIGVRELAEAAMVSTNTITRFERGEPLKERTVDAIQAALESFGIEFRSDARSASVIRLHRVDPVDWKLLKEANDAVYSQNVKGDATIALVAYFNGRLAPEKLRAINYRLIALARFLKRDDKSPWVLHVKGTDYKVVKGVMIHAAAVTPLLIRDDQPVGDLAFDVDLFQKNALRVARAHGSA
jgi:transcriptional regulator with XRE-family HTH domain